MRRTCAAAAALLAGLVLVACESDAGPGVATPTSPTPSTSAPTTSTPPTTPPSSQPPKQESAKDFVRRYMAENRSMQATGDTSVIEMLSSPGCVSCNSFIESVKDVYTEGGSATVPESRLTKLRQVGRSNGFLIFEFNDTISGPTIIRDANGNETSRFPGGTNEIQMNVRKEGESWIVATITILSE